jgi:cobalt-zinc-cadmium efflux system outer membrane protein
VSRIFVAGATLACLVFESGCVKYQPHELNPVRTEAQFRARSLESKPDPESLMQYAMEFSPEVVVARAKVAMTTAALITARQRINPSLSGDGGYNKTPESVSTYSVSPAFTIETAGKRGYRILEAEKLAEASRIAVYETAWQVRSRVRASLLNYWAAQRRLALLQAENDLRGEVTGIYEKRVALGAASSPEWNAVRADQAALAVSIRNAQGDVAQALAAIAGAAGLPVSALEGKELDLSMFDTPGSVSSLPLLSVQKAGLLHRADIRRGLIEYEAEDARLRLVLANQYPNITLSPSYAFQEGFPAYTLGAALSSLPILHRNEGPIAEQEAARRESEARFLALQAKVTGETELALRQYTAALAEWNTAKDTLTPLQQQREAAVLVAFKAGENDRLEVTLARLATLAAQRAQTDALVRAQTALGLLEDAVQSALAAGMSAPHPETTN